MPIILDTRMAILKLLINKKKGKIKMLGKKTKNITMTDPKTSLDNILNFFAALADNERILSNTVSVISALSFSSNTFIIVLLNSLNIA